MDTQNTTEMEDPLLVKRVNKDLVFDVYNSNTDRPANSTLISLSSTNSVERRWENYTFATVVAHRLHTRPRKYNRSLKCELTEK